MTPSILTHLSLFVLGQGMCMCAVLWDLCVCGRAGQIFAKHLKCVRLSV